MLSVVQCHSPLKVQQPQPFDTLRTSRCLSTRHRKKGIADEVALPEVAGFDEEPPQPLQAVAARQCVIQQRRALSVHGKTGYGHPAKKGDRGFHLVL